MHYLLLIIAFLFQTAHSKATGSLERAIKSDRRGLMQMQDNSLTIGHAKSIETEELVKLINDAYTVEIGDTGVAFKKDGVNRFRSPAAIEEFGKSVSSDRCLLLRDGQEILACLVYEVNEEDDGGCSVFFGPFAAKTKGKGHGMLLYEEFQRMAKEVLMAKAIKLYVVNHRTELIQLYSKLGFVVEENTANYPNPEVLSRPSHFIIMKKILS